MKTWKARVQEIYYNLDELDRFDQMYGIVARCTIAVHHGRRIRYVPYASAEDLWCDNPMIGGSTNPADFGVVRKGERIKA